MQIKNLIQTCNACPSQWEFETDDGRFVYVRYRYAHLSIRVSPPNATHIMEAVWGTEIYTKTIGDDPIDGIISWADVEPIIRSIDLKEQLSLFDSIEETGYK